MASTVVPATEVSGDLLRTFLDRIGMSREIAEWRYFDAAFNRGRNRAFVWLREGRIDGMVGLIPFVAASGKERRPVEWISDWILADPPNSLGMGVMLLKRAIAAAGGVLSLGGNETATKLMPRIATRTIPDAGLGLHLPLRSGALLRVLERRSAALRVPKPRATYRIPLRWVPRSGRSDVATTAGLDPRIGPLLEMERNDGWYPRYDLEYVDWQVGRSPLLHCTTSCAPAAGTPRAAVLAWRPRASTDFWRIAAWWHPEYPEYLTAVIREAVSRVYEAGGWGISAIVSHRDAQLIGALKTSGFVGGGLRRPLFLCTSKEAAPLDELRGLSYLDTDTAYRFYL